MPKIFPTTPLREFNSAGCFAVLLSFSANLLWGNIYKSVSVLLPMLRDQFTTQTWIIGIMTSAMTVVADTAGLLSGILEAKFGTRRMLIFSNLMVSVGWVLIPRATSLMHIAISLSFIVGPGMGIIGILNRAILGRHFTKHYTLACGIGHSGQAVALVAAAPVMQLFLDTYGWRGAALLFGGICMNGIVCAALLRTARPQYQVLPGLSDRKESKGGATFSAKAFCLDLAKEVDLQILLQFNLWIVYACLSGLRFANNAWVVFYVPHLQAKGFSPQVSAALCSAAAAGYFLGTLVWGPVIDRGLLKCSTGVIINSLTLTLSLVLDPWAKSVLVVAVLTFIFGLSVSAMYTLLDVLTKELFEIDRLASAFGWVRALSFPFVLLAGFVTGWIYDNTGSYDLAFVVMGLVPTAALVPLVVGKLGNSVA